MRRRSIHLLVVLAALACLSKKNEITSGEELQVFVNAFYKESLIRSTGVQIPPGSLLVCFGKTAPKAGSCKPNSFPKVITIDSTFWKFLSYQEKEMLVYHELAHCVLNRPHNNEIFQFGECKSWMREYDSLCSINLVNEAWREYYLNELFQVKSASTPAWYQVNEQIPTEDPSQTVAGKISLNKSNAILFDTAFFQDHDNWIIKIDFAAPKEVRGYIGISINEYSVEFSGYTNLAPDSHIVFSKSILLSHPNLLRRKEIMVWDTLQSINEKPQLFIKKNGAAVFIFFHEELKLTIPIATEKITISGYSTFKNEEAVITTSCY